MTETIIADDDFSVYEETESTTTSLSESVLNYQYENGRRYHAYSQGKYLMPNDDAEQERLDLAHHIFSLILDGELFAAPVKQPQAILDLGTGTGIWAIDVADKFPSARVIGNDLSPIQPSWVPPNLEFVVDDFEKEWVYEQDSFDFVHARVVMGCVQDWPRLIRQIYAHLRPGGYFEVQESPIRAFSDDGTLDEDSPWMQYLQNLRDAGEKAGRPVDIAPQLKPWLEEAGFEDVTETIYPVPLGPWPKDRKLKEIGKYQYLHVPQATEAYGLRLYTQVLGWSEEEAKVHFALVKEQIRDRSMHAYNKLYVVYGRKPEAKQSD